MSEALTQRGGRLLPAIDRAMIVTVLLAGLAGLVAWEIWARAITPLWIGGPLEPAGLVQAVFGLGDRTIAQAIHILVGLIAYPIGYAFIARPVAGAVSRSLPWWLVSLVYGVALWVFALYVMAHLIAGFPAFLRFGNMTWASLIGHLLLALAIGAVIYARVEKGSKARHG